MERKKAINKVVKKKERKKERKVEQNIKCKQLIVIVGTRKNQHWHCRVGSKHLTLKFFIMYITVDELYLLLFIPQDS